MCIDKAGQYKDRCRDTYITPLLQFAVDGVRVIPGWGRVQTMFLYNDVDISQCHEHESEHNLLDCVKRM